LIGTQARVKKNVYLYGLIPLVQWLN